MQNLIASLETSFFYDLPNFFLCVLLVIFVSRLVKLPKNYTILLLFHCLVPFLLNDVLFSASYLGDQFRYTAAVREIRSTLELITESGNVANASWLLAFIPIPFVETVSSLGFANKVLFILTFAFLYSKKVLTPFAAYFLLLYPSLILYTSLSLRDTIIFCCMLLAAYHAVKRNYFCFVLFLSPLALIKFQNFYMMLPFFAFMFFNIGKTGLSATKGFLVLGIAFVVLIASFPVAGPLINMYRLAMYREDGGVNLDEVPLINGVGDFIYLGLTSGLYFFIKPLPWESNSAMQLIQSLENIAIMYLVIKLTIIAYIKDAQKMMFWLILFIGSMSIYGLVVFNFGTAARYRFPFIVIYVVFVCYVCGIYKVIKTK